MLVTLLLAMQNYGEIVMAVTMKLLAQVDDCFGIMPTNLQGGSTLQWGYMAMYAASCTSCYYPHGDSIVRWYVFSCVCFYASK